ncbi:efflux RND transporter periplasmic adaptor subunit [Granulicella sp. L46]|uniref:efflux RND transporter periplasmic adaptor subunit n=1 Tax=Granulicella sp. L46 TaxID=1641865 RepID=UPI00131C065D|nr:efflux RND transporter periplasmic adaptor subunit [Granulicella sp. L46]
MTSRNTVQSVITLATVLSAFSMGLLSGCKSEGPPPGAAGFGPLPVQVSTAVQQDVPLTGEWVATTDGFVNAQIQPQVSGYLIRQDYKEGSEVHKGQVLFEIDPRPFQAILDQATASVAQAQAQYELAGINVRRDTPLAEAHAIAQSQLDNDIQTQAANKAAVANAQASVEAAELNVGFTKVRSLIDGVAGQAALQVGNLVNTSSVLTSVSQLNPIKVYFYISEQEYLTLSAQAKQRGVADLLRSGNVIPLKLKLANNQVYPQTGRIIFVDRALSSQTGSIRMAAQFANPGNLLRPGQFGRVSAETTVLHNAVVVPQRAVSEMQGMNQVIVVGADNVAHIRTVQLGTQVGPNIVISSGLSAGDRVVTAGNEKVRDGMKVVPQADNSPAPAAAGQNAQGN